MFDDDSTVWVLVQFKPNSDAVAVRNLERQGITVFLPRIKQTVRRAERFVTAVKPLFPGYLFARIGLQSGGWRVINSTYGVSRIVSTGDRPSPVPEGLVASIKARCSDQDIVEAKPAFSAGDTVTVHHGPFADWVGEIVEMTADQRAWVLLDLMGRKTRVAVNLNDLAAV